VRRVAAARILRFVRAMTSRLNKLTEGIIGAAIEVHRTLGPGLLESAYGACLAYELSSRGLEVERQKRVPVRYHDVVIDCAYCVDFVVGAEVVIEIKAVERLTPVHDAQLITYLRLLDKRVGLLINFNVKRLADGGIRRLVNQFPHEGEGTEKATAEGAETAENLVRRMPRSGAGG
jgi:GxxExxY protein